MNAVEKELERKKDRDQEHCMTRVRWKAEVIGKKVFA